MTIDDELNAYFKAARERCLFQWGIRDCCLEPANWVQFATGTDPAERFRGAYSDRAGAEAFLKEAGGVLRIIDQSARGAGLARVQVPLDGDVGCITFAGETIGTIRAAGGWSILSETRGRLILPDREVRFHMAWSFL